MNLNIILLFAAIFGIVLVTILLTKKNTNKVSTLFLTAFYFIFSVYCIQTYIIVSGLLRFIPWFYGWPLPLYALTPVSVYFYYISILKDRFYWKWKYLIIFIPFVLSFIDVILLYLKPNNQYNEIILNAIVNPKARFEAKYGLFTLLHHYTIRHFFLLIYLVLLIKPIKSFICWNTKDALKKILNIWLLIFFVVIISIALLSSILGIEDIFDISIFGYIFKTKQIYFTLIFIIYLFALIIGVAPLYFPSILYGFPQSTARNVKKTSKKNEIIKDKYGLDETEILKKLESLIAEEIYLQNNFDLNQLSTFLDIPVHHASYFLNQHYKISFATYRNQLRMEYAKKMIISGYLNQNTIEALTWKCGFSSRSAYTKTFKTYTGLNPSEFTQ